MKERATASGFWRNWRMVKPARRAAIMKLWSITRPSKEASYGDQYPKGNPQ